MEVSIWIILLCDTRLTVVWLQYLEHFFTVGDSVPVYLYCFFRSSFQWMVLVFIIYPHLNNTQCGESVLTLKYVTTVI